MRTDRRPVAFGAALLLGAHAALAQPAVVVSPTGAVRTVTEALRVAPAGARIVIRAGTYREPTLHVTRAVTIVGEGLPTLDGENAREIMVVTARDVTVRGVRFARVGTAFTEDRAALRVRDTGGCTIADNRFDDTFFGVYLANVAGCRIERNVLSARKTGESASGNGIHLWSARDVVIADNQIRGHRDGIYFEFVRASTVERNVSERNLRYGLHFMYSDSCRYLDNTFRANGSGVAVMYTKQVVMRGNRFEDNRGGAAYGLLLKEIGDPVLEGNTFARNTVGLMADGTTRLLASRNVFASNGWGVRLMSNVQDSRFDANDFSANTFDVATSGRDATAAFAGNWFDAYRGYDLDRDGRGDVPHRPVRLFSLLVARYEPSMVLLRSFFVDLLDVAERGIPSLTPDAVVDAHPAMRPVARRTTVSSLH
ncbi:nitrous oxide reductase family maturation protein NosD [Gemmatirosa kalamazoonensis]|uniref:nitrous oxide reductase family maturation protein NosD n=1 Tax=Gemmatirosa kalamazoonensis TaxID=861299 RepID=UPI00130E06FF|nr:nitrous oxide reductase family maturation protein NosD [Gemmatirosa kalamazoonensis]